MLKVLIIDQDMNKMHRDWEFISPQHEYMSDKGFSAIMTESGMTRKYLQSVEALNTPQPMINRRTWRHSSPT
jgi:hypothetical protein